MPTSWAPPFLSVQLDTTKKQGEISSSKTPSQTKVEHKYYTLASIKERQKLYLRNSLHERETSWIRVLKGLKKRCLSSLNFFWCCWILYIHTHTDNLLKFKNFFFQARTVFLPDFLKWRPGHLVYTISADLPPITFEKIASISVQYKNTFSDNFPYGL